MKKFSFVIPTYQNQRYLRNTLHSINRLEGFGKDEYEVIVVDDGSTDDTQGYIKDINKNFDLKYIYLERCGYPWRSRARNTGWKAADGEVVIFLDSDMLVRSDYLLEMDKCFQLNKDIQVVGTRLMLLEDIDEECVINGELFENYTFDKVGPLRCGLRHLVFNKFSYNSSAYLYPWFYVYTCSVAVPKKWLEITGGYDENFIGFGVEDTELAYRLHLKGVKVIYTSKLESIHQYHACPYYVPKHKLGEVERNVYYFIEKHKNTINIPENDLLNFHKGFGKAKVFLGVKPEGPMRTEIVEYKDKSLLESIKEEILSLSNQKRIRLVVNDYVEDTGFATWIQLLGQRNSTPKYFPVSKKINPKDWAKIRKQLYK